METPPPKRGAEVCQDRVDQVTEKLKKRREVTRLLKRYDTNNSGKLEKGQVKNLLTDLDDSTPPGTAPKEEELKFIIKVEDKAGDGCLAFNELEEAVQAWRTFTAKRV